MSARQPAAQALRATPAAIKAPTALATSPFSNSIRVFLDSAATWLAGFPANPITDALQGAVWAVRRTLFPATVGVITAPIKVPLTEVQVCFGTVSSGGCSVPTVSRLGIWLTLGSGSTIPQFFEFDTGSAGFLAAYASSDPTASPWWGSAGVTTGEDVSKSFDSGTKYSGLEATTTVSFYNSATDATPLLSTGRIKVGQVTEMTTGTDKDPTYLWTADGSDSPPIDGFFYGDFGASPTYESNGITSVLNELTFARGVTAGFRIDYDPDATTADKQWSLQIGLDENDVENPAGAYFSMVPDSSAPGGATNPNSGTDYFAQQLILGTVTIPIPGAPGIQDSNVGITPDTGADTAVHNTNRSSQDSAIAYAAITDGSKLTPGLVFSLSGTTTGGSSAQFFSETTVANENDVTNTSEGVVTVQNGTSAKDIYYVNTGIQLFFQNAVVYDMRNGRLGLITIPTASQ